MSDDQLIFQILDILPRDEIIVSESDDVVECEYESDGLEDDDEDAIKRRRARKAASANKSQLLIHIFGRSHNTSIGSSIRIDVHGFCPYFYVEIPQNITSVTNYRVAMRQLKEYIEKHCIFANQVTTSLELREKFYGYTNNKTFAFVKLTVKSMQHFYNLRQMFLSKHSRPQLKFPIGGLWGKAAPDIYESNLDPMLRFLHTQNIQPCGWITVKDVSVRDANIAAINDEAIRVHYKNVLPVAAPIAAAPFITISWDIECFSSSGDFPLAKKTYKKVAKDLYTNATSGEHAVELIDNAMIWDNNYDVQAIPGSLMSPIICKYRLPPDSRRIFRAAMYKDSVYSSIEKHLRARSEANGVDRETAITNLTTALTTIMGGRFPLGGDPVIQVGAVVSVNNTVTERHVFVYPSCDDIEGVTVHVSPTESDMIKDWFKWAREKDPDILVGYNVFGFDERYMWDRIEELGLEDEDNIQAMNRLFMQGGVMKCTESFLSSSALGDNYLYMWATQGRLEIDLYHYVKRTMNLASYKLDDVAMNLMSGSLGEMSDSPPKDGILELKLKGSTKDIRVGRAIKLLDESDEALTAKMEILEVYDGGKRIKVGLEIDNEEWISLKEDAASWVIVKDDVTPAEIFKFHCGSSADRAKVAKYCIQDCDLVLELYKKLEVFMNAMAMANVCSVPVRYIFTRGQGIKIESLIAKECLELNKCILTLPSPEQGPSDAASYEGAIVLDPIPSFYNRSPIGVGDFASLYPSTIISENISHDTLVWVKDYDDDGYLINHVWGSSEYDGLEDVDYTDIKFDLLIPDPEDNRKTPRKIKAGNRICRYAQDKDGAMPIILKKLLAARKAKRNEAAKETDPMRQTLLDTEQLAYKLTANSLYGQLGSRTFKMRLQDLAASTTAYGRLQIMFAKAVIEKFYGPGAGDPRCEANIMYGDTDSLFIEFNPRNPETGERLVGREARQTVIDLTTEAGHLVTHALKPPHDFEFDKVFDPMLMFSKKRYAGKMFESNADDFVYKYMGIALKRRDSAPIVKKIYGNAMKMVLDYGDVAGATKYVQDSALELVQGNTSLGLLMLTKSLKADYPFPQRIAHKVLADRMAARDPGTAPAAGDRICFVYIKPAPGQPAPKLQGDRIETPAYIKSTPGVELDAVYYIEHQIKVPVSQMFGLLLEDMPGFKKSMLPDKYDDMDAETKIAFREQVAEKILFTPALQSAAGLDKKRFISAMFKGAAVTTTTKAPATAKKSRSTTNEIVNEKPKKVQSRMTNFLEVKELISMVKRLSDDNSSTGSRSSGGSSKKR